MLQASRSLSRFAHCFDFSLGDSSSSSDGSVEDFTSLDDSAVSYRVWKERMMCYSGGNGNGTKNCHCGMVSPHYLELKIVGVDSSIMQLQWTVSLREKVTWDGWNVLTKNVASHFPLTSICVWWGSSCSLAGFYSREDEHFIRLSCASLYWQLLLLFKYWLVWIFFLFSKHLSLNISHMLSSLSIFSNGLCENLLIKPLKKKNKRF